MAVVEAERVARCPVCVIVVDVVGDVRAVDERDTVTVGVTLGEIVGELEIRALPLVRVDGVATPLLVTKPDNVVEMVTERDWTGVAESDGEEEEESEPNLFVAVTEA